MNDRSLELMINWHQKQQDIEMTRRCMQMFMAPKMAEIQAMYDKRLMSLVKDLQESDPAMSFEEASKKAASIMEMSNQRVGGLSLV